MRPDNRFEDLDKAALKQALLSLGVCPKCRTEIQPVALLDSVWGCPKDHETWYRNERGGWE